MVSSNSASEVLGIGLVVLAMLIAPFLPAIAGPNALLVVGGAIVLAHAILIVRFAASARRGRYRDDRRVAGAR